MPVGRASRPPTARSPEKMAGETPTPPLKASFLSTPDPLPGEDIVRFTGAIQAEHPSGLHPEPGLHHPVAAAAAG